MRSLVGISIAGIRPEAGVLLAAPAAFQGGLPAVRGVWGTESTRVEDRRVVPPALLARIVIRLASFFAPASLWFLFGFTLLVFFASARSFLGSTCFAPRDHDPAKNQPPQHKLTIPFSGRT